MLDDAPMLAADGLADDTVEPPDGDLALSEADLGEVEQALVATTLRQPSLAAGTMVAAFEQRFAEFAGRAHAVAVASGTIGTWLALRALGLGAGHEVVASSYGWHQVAHAVTLAGATPRFADIHYWSGCLDPVRAAAAVTPATKAIMAGNVNGHPADWDALRALANDRGLALIEDSTEALGSVYRGRTVGSFGDVAVFDFSAPSALQCGQGGMVVTDDAALAAELRYLRQREAGDRRSVSVGARVPLQAAIGEPVAAIGVAQLARLPEILERRKDVEGWYLEQLQTFEGIKPPYLAPGVDRVHWMLMMTHLGKRFTASACDQIVEDLAEAGIEAALYCQPLHQQFHYRQRGWQRGQLPLAERIADRALVLPFHGHLTAAHVKFIVKTMKDSTLNVGAGAAIY